MARLPEPRFCGDYWRVGSIRKCTTEVGKRWLIRHVRRSVPVAVVRVVGNKLVVMFVLIHAHLACKIHKPMVGCRNQRAGCKSGLKCPWRMAAACPTTRCRALVQVCITLARLRGRSSVLRCRIAHCHARSCISLASAESSPRATGVGVSKVTISGWRRLLMTGGADEWLWNKLRARPRRHDQSGGNEWLRPVKVDYPWGGGK